MTAHHKLASLPGLNVPGSWADDALCAEIDHDLFFPEKGGDARQGKTVCARCPVAAECLDHALTNNEAFGIWGGLPERERHALQRSS